MNYYYHTLPRFERSSSLDRGIYEHSGRRIQNLSNNLFDDYLNTRNKSVLADSTIIRNFNRALSASPGRISVIEPSEPIHSTVSRRKVRRHSISYDDDVLPTSYLKAHAPPQYSYLFDPYSYNFRPSRYYWDNDVTIYPSYYHNYRTHYIPRTYSSYYSHGIGLPELHYPRQRSVYSLSRVPESQYYYRYNVMPFHGYDANDMLRERRRKANRHIGTRTALHAPPVGFFSGLKSSLNNILDKMESHRLLLDRYIGIDMAPSSNSVGDNILEKSLQMSYRKRY